MQLAKDVERVSTKPVPLPRSLSKSAVEPEERWINVEEDKTSKQPRHSNLAYRITVCERGCVNGEFSELGRVIYSQEKLRNEE